MPDSNPDTIFRILVIDDTAAIHEDFRKILRPEPTPNPRLHAALSAVLGPREETTRRKNFEVDFAFQGQEGLDLLRLAKAANRPYALAFVDMRIPPGWDGIETIRHLWQEDPSLQAVICTAYSDYSWNQTLQALGHTDNLVILKKPFDNIEVLQLAHALTQKWAATRVARARLIALDELVRQRTANWQASEERFSTAFQGAPLPSALISLTDERFLDVNAALVQLLGLSREVLLQTSAPPPAFWAEPGLWAEVLRELRAQHAIRDRRTQITTRDGSHREILLTVQPLRLGNELCAFAVLQDITERLRLEDQLRQAQKMEAIGQLAAGIAHDFNNLLTVILGYTSEILEGDPVTGELRDSLSQVRAAAERAATLTRQLLVFSRRQTNQLKPLNLATTILGLREMLVRLIGEQIEVVWDCPPNLPPIFADNADLEQVVMNLMVNARDAMPQGGRIEVHLREVHLNDEVRRHPDARPGHYLCLAISDTGTGMEPAVLQRLFEPFFTTKPVGRGTGLGLSTVYAIVHQLHGWIEVDSALGRGSAFTLYFPVLAGEIAPAPTSASAVSAQAPAPHGHERVLFVEDDANIRTMLSTFLKRQGYQVTVAPDGPSALEAWNLAHGEFDLLISDMIMPNGLSGAQISDCLRQSKPELKTILISGYSPELLEADSTQKPNVWTIMKPFQLEVLTQTIRTALDAPAEH
ncbi:MAG: response regulator [Opitutae bacterium]|nr:response regulator [Opitutae bacterium]